jgi:hypothetical protein
MIFSLFTYLCREEIGLFSSVVKTSIEASQTLMGGILESVTFMVPVERSLLYSYAMLFTCEVYFARFSTFNETCLRAPESSKLMVLLLVGDYVNPLKLKL